MLERVFWLLINRYLSSFVQIDRDALRASVWNGDVQLHNLKISPNLFANIDIPITIVRGNQYSSICI